MPYMLVRKSEIETASKEGGRVQLYIGSLRGFGRPFDDKVFGTYFDPPNGYIRARKEIVLDIQAAFPSARFGIEVKTNFSDGLGKIMLNEKSPTEKPKDDKYFNLYLVFEKGAEDGAL